MRHFLNITDLADGELDEVLDLAERPVASLGRPLADSGVALIFEKPSNRTRHSMEMAVVQLGGHPVYTRGEEVGLDRREPVEDVARIMAGYHRVLAARVFSHSVLERMVAALDRSEADCSVVNLLSELSHPLQALADLLTMRQQLGGLADRTVAWIGDYNNVARSLGEAAALAGMHLRYSGPDGYLPEADELERLLALGAPSAVAVSDPREAAAGAHAVHTDTWVSMGDENEADERRRLFSAFCVDEAVMSAADPEAVFMHCLPAYRGLEVTAEVIDGPRSVVIEQGHNRLHSARALLALLMGVRA